MSFRLRSGKRGVAIRLHELEAEVMDAIWSRKLQRFAVSEVLVVLEKRRDIAYTTVMTTVARLHDKGLLKREREGKRYLYDVRLTREEFLQQTAREVLQQIGEPAGRESLAFLVDTITSADADALDELERIIELRRKELGS
ncbi:MAG TPA: BlaI/MecI/CopY family transcriptional regulator [Polyangiaceae bacterium]|nr:BlaI/MecI/CopY family transcriptional regulator [Polyangiaceae bacterium]